jgi:hypothetical protein
LQDAAARLSLQPGDDPEQRGLAAARWAEETHQLARRDDKIDRLQGDEVAEGLVYAFKAQGFRGRRLLFHQ